MAKVATPRPAASQRTRSRTSVSENSDQDTRAVSETTFSSSGESHHVWHCDIKGCSKFFMREADLRRHQRTSKQHNSKAYYCGCGRSFTRQDATRRHCLSFGHEIPASVLRGIPDDGPPPLAATATSAETTAAAVTPARGAAASAEDPSPADGIALLMAAAASLSSFASATTPDADSSNSDEDADGETEDEAEPVDFTSSSASSSQYLAKPAATATQQVERRPLDASRKRKFTLDDDASSIDLASSWSSDSFAVLTPSSHVSSSPDESGSGLSVQQQQRRPQVDVFPGIRRSTTFDLNDNILTLAAVTIEAHDEFERPLNRIKRSRSLLDATLDFPVSHASRLESRSESAAFMASPLQHAQYA